MPGLSHVFDTIGASQSSATASQAVGEQGGVLCTVRPGKANTESVTERTKVTDVLVWTAFLKDHRYGDFFWPVSIESKEWKKGIVTRLTRPRQAKTIMSWLLNYSRSCRPGSKQELSSQACQNCLERSTRCLQGSRNTGMGKYRDIRLCTSWITANRPRL